MVEISPLTRLAVSLKNVQFVFPADEFSQAEELRIRVKNKLDNQVLPRLRNLNAPLVCVLAGATGSGKSTLVNSLLQTDVSAASAMRPTTRRPVLIHSPEDAKWFTGNNLLPQLAKVQVEANHPPTTVGEGKYTEVEIRGHEALPPGLALLDAPDFNSIEDGNRKLAKQLLDIADMWVFVTTATRYADALPWEFLKEAKARNIKVFVVLNRTPFEALEEVKTDFQRLLFDAGLDNLPFLGIGEQRLVNGRIPFNEVEPLDSWLHSHAVNAQTRIITAMRSLLGAGKVLVVESEQVLEAVNHQFLLAADALEAVGVQQRLASERVNAAIVDGVLLRGEVLAYWQQVAGVSELTQQLERGLTLLKLRFKRFFTGRKTEITSIEGALASGLQTIISAELFAAETAVRRSWAAHPQIRDLEARVSQLSSEQVNRGVRELTVSWQQQVLEIIRLEGSTKHTTAKIMAAGVNLLGVALMLVVFATTGGITGAELGVAGTTSVVAQKLLEVVFGDQAVKKMTDRARELLLTQVTEFYRKQLGVLEAAIPAVANPEELVAAITLTQSTLSELEVEVKHRLGGGF